MSKPTYNELEKELFELKNVQFESSKSQMEVINALKRTEEKVNISYEFLSQIINNIYDPVFVKDDQSRLIFVNDAFCEIFNVPRSAVIGKTLAEHVPEDEREHFLKVDKEVIESGNDSLIEESLSVAGKPTLTIRTKKTRFINKSGDTFLVGVIHDITDSKKNEVELNYARAKAEESDRLKSAFLANISHEIRTPMNGILGFSELLKKKNISVEKKEEYLDIIEKEGTRLLSFISDIVDISKIESNVTILNTSSCNINSLIDELHSKYSTKLTNTAIKLIAKKGLGDLECMVETDKNKLVQIMSNLLENAIKFTHEGVIEFGYALSAGKLNFFVQDTGIGIEFEDCETIFDRFTQGKQEQTYNLGAGLGLSIVKGLIQILGGEVRVESKIGVGSTFFVTIPYEKVVTDTEVEVISNDRTLDKDYFTILIAEDEFIIFMFLRECLSDVNCSIIHASNGEKAVKKLEQNPSVDIILMDINMPKMDGYEALNEIRKTNKEIPIIAQTGMAMQGDREKILEAGFNDYISKPISINRLITSINKHLKKTIEYSKP